MRGIAIVGLLAVVVGASAGCEESLECGDGTRLVDGTCVLEKAPELAQCGFGTAFDDGSGLCLPLFPPTSCGEQPSCSVTEEGYYQCGCGDAIVECP